MALLGPGDTLGETVFILTPQDEDVLQGPGIPDVPDASIPPGGPPDLTGNSGSLSGPGGQAFNAQNLNNTDAADLAKVAEALRIESIVEAIHDRFFIGVRPKLPHNLVNFYGEADPGPFRGNYPDTPAVGDNAVFQDATLSLFRYYHAYLGHIQDRVNYLVRKTDYLLNYGWFIHQEVSELNAALTPLNDRNAKVKFIDKNTGVDFDGGTNVADYGQIYDPLTDTWRDSG